MEKPIVSFVIFNKSGIAANDLLALLKTSEDFELYIVDNGSTDDTWKFIETLDDPRIKEKKRFDVNRGGIYAINYVLSHRKPNQYYVNIDSDVYVETDKWYEAFMETFEAFPELGMIGATPFPELQGEEHPEYGFHLTEKAGKRVYKLPALIGCFMCIRPEVLNTLGYFCEETCAADKDISKRIHLYTPYEIGAMPDLKMTQHFVACTECPMKAVCSYKVNQECHRIYQLSYHNHTFFKEMIMPKMKQFDQELAEGKRTPYCASIHDKASLEKTYYDYQSAEENFNFFASRMQPKENEKK